MIQVKPTKESFHDVLDSFQSNRRVFYSRFGDGDVYIMMGRDQANHLATPSLTQEMIESFTINHPQYLKGLAVNHPREKAMVRGLFAVFRDNREMVEFLERQFGKLDNILFENPVFLHYLSVFNPQEVNAFLDKIIRPKRKMYIGSIPKEKIEKIIGAIDFYVQTPPKNAYANIDEWWPEVMRNIHQVELVIPAAGMATRVINKRLWNLNLEIQSFDIGSLVDVADSRQSRKWIRLAGHRIERYIINPNKELTTSEHLAYLKKETKLKFYSFIKRTFS